MIMYTVSLKRGQLQASAGKEVSGNMLKQLDYVNVFMTKPLGHNNGREEPSQS